MYGPSLSVTIFGTDGGLLLSSTYLLRRGKRWYFRFHIPVPLRPFFGGKHELRKSLKTSVYTTAKSLLPGHPHRTDKLFAKLRARAHFLVVPSSAYPKASSYKFVSAGINHKIAGI